MSFALPSLSVIQWFLIGLLTIILPLISAIVSFKTDLQRDPDDYTVPLHTSIRDDLLYALEIVNTKKQLYPYSIVDAYTSYAIQLHEYEKSLDAYKLKERDYFLFSFFAPLFSFIFTITINHP